MACKICNASLTGGDKGVHSSILTVKLTEVTPDKKIVWTHRDPKKPGIHHFQILEPDGGLPAGRVLR
jgi:hypothetical protein